jgi:hypothetical protein
MLGVLGVLCVKNKIQLTWKEKVPKRHEGPVCFSRKAREGRQG